MIRRTAAAALIVLALGASAACGADQQPPAAAGDPAGGAPSSIPAEVAAHAADWPLPNRDYANSRATTDAGIDSSNVATLAEAWRADLSGPGTYGNAATTPIV